MDIDIILECDVSPAQIAELAVAAEKLGIRALWTSNYHQNYDCFMALMPAAEATTQIKLGPLAVSPWELHPLKMANSLLTLNQHSKGRGMVAVSGGGGVLGAIGWRINKDGPVWPLKDPVTQARYPERRVRGLQECIEVLNLARSGKMVFNYDGEIFQVTRPFKHDWHTAETGPIIYGCCSGPMMIRTGARIADAIQLSDYTVDMMPHAIENLEKGFETRQWPRDDFRIGNFWAWHIKEDADASWAEARRELILRGYLGKQYFEPFLEPDELQLMLDHFDDFLDAWKRGSAQINNVPDELVRKMVSNISFVGGLEAIDQALESLREFAAAGLTEIALRVHDDPADAIRLIGERIRPYL